jgi:Fic family protein
MKSSSKEIIKIHETNQLSSLEKSTSHSYLLELLRKKYVEEQQTKNGGIAKYDEMMAAKDYCTIERHTK